LAVERNSLSVLRVCLAALVGACFLAAVAIANPGVAAPSRQEAHERTAQIVKPSCAALPACISVRIHCRRVPRLDETRCFWRDFIRTADGDSYHCTGVVQWTEGRAGNVLALSSAFRNTRCSG
jgi:hypothetical protein